MTIKEFTKENLSKLTTKQIKAIDVVSVEQEKIISEILAERATITNNPIKFNYRNVPDIKTPEQEKEWQSKVDSFNEKNKPVEVKIIEAQKELETIKTEASKLIESLPIEVTPEPSVIVASENLKCDECDKVYASEVTLKAHKTRSHKSVTTN